MNTLCKNARSGFLSLVALAALAALGLAPQPAQAQADTTMTQADITAPATSMQLMTAEDADLGSYLTDADGRAVYLFKADSAGTSACYGECADAWPPLVGADPQAGEGVEASLLGTIEREDGQMQVTYGGHPLYYFVRDEGPGQTQGQDVMGFGAEWYLVTPEGEAVHSKEHEMEEEDGR